MGFNGIWPSAELSYYGKIRHFTLGKTPSGIFQFSSSQTVSHYQRVHSMNIPLNHNNVPLNHTKIPLNDYKIPS